MGDGAALADALGMTQRLMVGGLAFIAVIVIMLVCALLVYEGWRRERVSPFHRPPAPHRRPSMPSARLCSCPGAACQQLRANDEHCAYDVVHGNRHGKAS